MKKCELTTEQICDLIKSELCVHPLLEPVDLYKLLYQAMYGPSHIVRDLGQVSLNISSELGQMTTPYEPLYQNIGARYTRISLSVLRLGNIIPDRQLKIEALSRWILASCSEYAEVSSDFLSCWNSHLSTMQSLLSASPEAWDKASALAEAGKIPSHSELFHRHYDPHYRLVRMDNTEHYQHFMELKQ